MKIFKNICLYIMLLGVAAVNSCSDDAETTSLEVSTQQILLDVWGLNEDERPAPFTVTTSALSWKAVCAKWITLSAVSGSYGTAEITAYANSTTSVDREGYITITSGDQRVVISVIQSTQEAVPSTLTVNSASITVGADGLTTDGNKHILKISTNKNWSMSGLPTWVTAEPVSGIAGTEMNVTLTVQEYADTQKDRTATFAVNAGLKSQTITLTQTKKIGPLSVSWMLPAKTFTAGVADDGSANLSAGEWWVKEENTNSILRAFRAGETSNAQKTMSYTTTNPADGDRILLYGMVQNDYWQMEIPTTGIAAGATLKIESEMQSSGTGPRDFLFQYSKDKNTWTSINPTVDGDITYTVRLGSAMKTPISQEFTLAGAIPAGTLYIRLLISGPTRADGTANIGAGGTCRVCRPQYTSEADMKPIMKVFQVTP